MPYSFYITVCLWLAVFGACIGSFINVVVYRLPHGNFFSQARSFCPACKEKLRWTDLLPIASYLILKGRCRYCHAPISPRYPLVEAACGILAVLCFLRFGWDIRTGLVFGTSVILLAVSLIDADTMEIPNELVVALIPFAVCAVWGWRDIPLGDRVIGFFIISGSMFLLTLIVHGAFGGGDIKLMAVCGFMLGWKITLVAFFIALLTGGGYASFLLVTKKGKRGEHMAFGPYLCAGVVAALFFGAEMLRFYLKLYL